MTIRTSRVNSGRRSTYDRTRVGLKGSGGKAVGVVMFPAIPRLFERIVQQRSVCCVSKEVA